VTIGKTKGNLKYSQRKRREREREREKKSKCIEHLIFNDERSKVTSLTFSKRASG
jgi:hypothetical protein